MKRTALGLAVAALGMVAQAQAASISSSFNSLGGNSWSVDLTVTGDGTPTELTGFTVYFSEASFANLVLAASPSTWDSLVIPPDVGIPAAGYLDSFVLDPLQALTSGQSQAGFTVEFTYLGTDAPGALPFDIVDANYNVLAEGRTVPTSVTAAVPEPSTYLMMALGLGLLGLTASRRNATRT